MEMLSSGTLAGSGSFSCQQCGYVVSLAAADALPKCPSCGGQNYNRASLFTSEFDANLMPTGPAAIETTVDWIDEARESIDVPGQYLAYMDSDKLICFQIERELLKIGRSLSADVRFDDPTVSRRHALIAVQGEEVRVMDDRSLNGIFVNGERVEWHALNDGDEIIVGRHQLRFIDSTPSDSASASTGESGTAQTA